MRTLTLRWFRERHERTLARDGGCAESARNHSRVRIWDGRAESETEFLANAGIDLIQVIVAGGEVIAFVAGIRHVEHPGSDLLLN